jgi:hypothetical protein
MRVTGLDAKRKEYPALDRMVSRLLGIDLFIIDLGLPLCTPSPEPNQMIISFTWPSLLIGTQLLPGYVSGSAKSWKWWLQAACSYLKAA